MPRPVCVPCQREMTCERSGAVTFTAIAVRGPYQQWQGDLYKCPGCGTEIVTSYGGRATWEHFRGLAGFDKTPVAVSHERGIEQPTVPPDPPERD